MLGFGLTALCCIGVLTLSSEEAEAGYWPDHFTSSISKGGCLYGVTECQKKFLTFECKPGEKKETLVDCVGDGSEDIGQPPVNSIQ